MTSPVVQTLQMELTFSRGPVATLLDDTLAYLALIRIDDLDDLQGEARLATTWLGIRQLRGYLEFPS